VSRNPALDAEKIRIIKVQSAAIREGSFFLAGGTGLAVRLKHRTSRDLDWFTDQAFDADSLRRTLEAAPEKPTRIEQSGPNTMRAYYGELETSFIHANHQRRPADCQPKSEAPALSAIPPANEDRFEAAAAEMMGAMGLLSRACWPRSW
jgi:hypothetical protein